MPFPHPELPSYQGRMRVSRRGKRVWEFESMRVEKNCLKFKSLTFDVEVFSFKVMC